MPGKWENKSYRRMAKQMEEQSLAERCRHRFRIRNPLVVNLLSEFFATFILLFVGTGIVAQHILTDGKMNSWLHIHLGWGILVALCVYGTFYTSGGHMNPAVSLAMFSLGKLSMMHVLFYSLVQTLAAFLGSGLSYMVYADEIQNFTGGVQSIAGDKATAGLFCSFPKPHISHSTAFVDQVVGTALLVLFISIIMDKRNKIPSGLQPLFFGLGLFIVGCSYGMNLGNPVNPARDFGPRVFAFLAGYSWEVFSWHGYYFWIPIVAPMLGGLLGAWSYQLFIGFHIHDPTISLQEGMQSSLAAVEINGLSAANFSELEPLSAET